MWDAGESPEGIVPPWGPRLLLGGVFLAYLATTVCLFFWGPWQYDIEDSSSLIAFLLAAHLALALGYIIGVRGRPASARLPMSIASVVLLGASLDLLLLFPVSRQYTGAWLPNPFVAATDFGTAYARSLTVREETLPWANYIRMAVAPLLASSLPLCVFYWTRLSLAVRMLFAASTIGTLALYTSIGANAGAAHWMALFPWFVIASHLAGQHRLRPAGWLKAGAVQLGSVVLFAVCFAAAMNLRSGSFAAYGRLPGIDARVQSADPQADLRPGAGMAGTVPEASGDAAPAAGTEPPPPNRGAVRIAFDGLAGYLSQGYYAVYLSLREPFVPMYGVGNSVFLQRQVARLTGNDAWLHQSYPARIESRGWNASGYWATIYPWIASDVGFPGTVAVMGFIGLLVGRVWRDALGNRNPWAVVLLGQLLLLLYYVPGHNKLMHTGEGISAFGVVLLGWLLTSRREARGSGGPPAAHAN